MIKFMGFISIVFLLMIPCNFVFASAADGRDIINSRMDSLNLGEIDEIIGGSSYSAVNKLSIEDLAMQAMEGKLDLSPQSIIKGIFTGFFGEFLALVSLVRNMLLISILGAFINNLSVSFKQKDVSELGFYMCYLTIIIILISSFNICVGVMSSLTNELCIIMQGTLPTALTLMAMSGNVGSAYVFSPVIIFIINALALFVRDVIAPVLIFATTLQLINYVSEKEILQKLSDLLKSCTSWALKGLAIIFVGAISLQGISVPVVNNAVSKSAKAALNIVPVVGQALNGAVDMVAYWSSTVKSGVMVAFIIVIVLMCAVPILKLIAFIAVFKITAAIIQPVSDGRIVKGIDCVGSFTAVLLGACVCVGCMFIFMVMVMLSI